MHTHLHEIHQYVATAANFGTNVCDAFKNAAEDLDRQVFIPKTWVKMYL